MSNKETAIIDGDKVYILQPGTKVYFKTADICSMVGKSNQWIGQLTNQGTIKKVKTKHGSMYEVADTVYRYCENISKKEIDEDDAKIEKTKRMAEAQIKASKATMAKLEADELRGKMHRSEDVEAITQDMVYAIRGALIALPGRLAVDTANAKTAAETAEIIRKEVHTVMNELANYQYDPSKYEERVRNRKEWDNNIEDDDE